MDLNKDIKLNIDLKNLDLKKNGVPILVSLISLMVFIYCLMNIFESLDNKVMLDQKQNEMLSINQQKISQSQQSQKLLSQHNQMLENLKQSPKTKYDMTEVLTNLVSQYRLELVEMTMKEEGQDANNPNAGGLDSANLEIELKVIGGYQKIIRFNDDLKKILAASKVESYQILKLEGKRGLQMNVNILFSPPPESMINTTQGMLYDDGYALAMSQRHPFLINVGYVENENMSEDLKDPFSEPQKPVVKQATPEAQAEQPAKPTFYLSGIMSSKKMSLCLITSSVGETRMYKKNDFINKVKISSVTDSYIEVCKQCNGDFTKIKIGGELPIE